jgi:uncharacterized coiled-coil protein SlyX
MTKDATGNDSLDRLEFLESTQAFQERGLEELHLALTEQQRQIDGLQRQMEYLLDRIRTLEATAPGESDSLPPHY